MVTALVCLLSETIKKNNGHGKSYEPEDMDLPEQPEN
jgi:hypothetical protein